MDGLGSAEIFEFEGFRLDRAGGCLSRMDRLGVAEPVTLGSRALALLAVLIDRQGQLVSKDEIFAAVWPGTAVEEANLTVQISALRRVLDRDRKQGSCIPTVPGRGYRFVVPVTQAEAAMAASFATDGNGSAGPLVADGQKTPRSVVCGTDDPTPTPTRVTRPWPGRAVMATTAIAALCLFAAAVAAVNWHSLTPGEFSSAPSPSIIVLPFASLGGDPDGQSLAEAVTADVTTDLSGIWDMVVISRDIASSYRGKTADAKQIGRELGVRYVLGGDHPAIR